ncbi:MAG: peptidoglycan DD-metalloendopeptidase family protein [Ignavibacteriaceae bacterium]
MKTFVVVSLFCLLLTSCKHNSSESEDALSPVEAKYVLPFPVGSEYMCSLGFNNSISHNGSFRYAVDFAMPIGTVITASRSGRVVYIVESNSDTDPTAGHENVVIVMHEDSTYARYVHLTTNGAMVTGSLTVKPGDTIGLSGNSGSSSAPHLHFDVTNVSTGRNDQTIPFDFKNTIAHPIGLEVGVTYKAFPY